MKPAELIMYYSILSLHDSVSTSMVSLLKFVSWSSAFLLMSVAFI